MKCFAMLLASVAAGLVTQASAAEFKSGLQAGDYPGAFHVTDVTGPFAGENLCYRCEYGARPVVSIFARKMDENVHELVKKIDEVVGKNKEQRMAAFVVLLTDQPKEQTEALSAAAKEHKITHTPLTTYNTANGPAKYRIHEDADVTVVMWVENDVKVNHAFQKGKLDAAAISKVVAATSSILN